MKTNHTNSTDQQLIAALKSGNEDAFNEIFDRYYVLLFSIACRRLNDREAAKDLIQAAFDGLWKNHAALYIPEDILSYLVNLIINRILKHYKTEQASQEYIDKFQKHIDTKGPVEQVGLSELIEKEIAALPEDMRYEFLRGHSKAKGL